jgi:sugar lactone lactonase YvrE
LRAKKDEFAKGTEMWNLGADVRVCKRQGKLWLNLALALSFAVLLKLGLTGCGESNQVSAAETTISNVYQNNDFQLTGVTLSKTGRTFVNFPRWSDRYLNAVVEVMPDGSTRPYPDENWNRWDLKPATADKQFVCVQSVVVDDADMLWVVDPAAPLLAANVIGGEKLVKIDLKTNTVAQVIRFSAEVAPAGSYLNDIRVDVQRNTAYLTDSGLGGIVVVDLATGKAHRALDGHPSVKAEMGIKIVIDGKPVLRNGKTPEFNSDGIALSPDGSYLYYQALTGATLYRIKTDLLRNASISAEAVSAGVEKVAKTFPVDGLWMDRQGRVYLSGLNQKAVLRLEKDGQIQTMVQDDRLEWPDTFSEGPDGAIYITASHINEAPAYNEGKSVRREPFAVFKFQPK